MFQTSAFWVKRCVAAFYISDISEFSTFRPSSGDLLKLFQLAIVDEVEKESAVQFFKSPTYFRQISKRLKDKLLDGILLNSFTQLTKFEQTHFRIRKRNLEMMMLLQSGKKETAITIGEETLLSAERYGLVDVALNMSRELEHHYSVVDTNTAKRDKYYLKNLRNQKLLLQEIKAQSLFSELAFYIKKNRSTEHVPGFIELLEVLSRENKEYKFNLYYYSVKNLYARYKGDQEQIIINCKEAADFFNRSTTILPYTTAWNFKFQMIPVYLTKRHFGNASILIEECLKLPSKGSYNWHLTLLYKAVLGFHNNKRLTVINAFQQAQKVPKKFKSDEVEGRWKIVGAYLALFKKVGQLKYPVEFRTYRFLNDTKANATAKVNMKILELLHLLLDGKKKAYMAIMEHIEQYISRNLKGNARAKYFLRMLRAVEDGDYNALRVEAHAKKHYDLLRRTASTININVLDSEPVPYSVLWEIVMAHLRP